MQFLTVAGIKFYCVYISPDEALIREHAQRGEFPVDLISKIQTIVDQQWQKDERSQELIHSAWEKPKTDRSYKA